MNSTAAIKQALADCAVPANAAPADVAAAAERLFNALGYQSRRIGPSYADIGEFVERFSARKAGTDGEKNFIAAAEFLKIIFQFSEAEIQQQQPDEKFNIKTIHSFLFVAVKLKAGDYRRRDYAAFTREINKRLLMPAVVLFFNAPQIKTPPRLTLSFVGRRFSKTDSARDVLQNVSLLRDIDCENPHRAHLDILADLSLENRIKYIKSKRDAKKEINFDGLLDAWLDGLDTEELNRQFYRELREWFIRAKDETTFPDAEKKEQNIPHVIRLLSRILFIWFIKEKGLVAPQLFREGDSSAVLKNYDREKGDDYYRAILQNLFFATLNTEIGKRAFSEQNYATHRDPSLLRYADLLADEKQLRKYLDKTPFVNGGLFECLDTFEGVKKGGKRVDCFSDNLVHRKLLSVPNRLFFGDGGLFALLNNYKFTVEENTPIEREVALDPELLGKVFENLAAEINPETAQNARKATGSFYTPRVIVNYMVRESLLAYFLRVMKTNRDGLRARLRALLTEENNYEESENKLNGEETAQFINAAGNLRLFDPAAGSGAFPMGLLQKMVLALKRLDPKNELLKKREMKRARAFEVEGIRAEAIALVERNFSAENSYNDYGRKLALIRDCIFGADIQPIAVQICRLRFFISLVIEQTPDKSGDNFGIQPLPNLETKILAADTLTKLATGASGTRGLYGDDAKNIMQELGENRRLFFDARTRKQKMEYRDKDEELRRMLADVLKNSGMNAEDADRIAEWKLYDETASADWFDVRWMFGIEEGFDVVIGNPPYVQLQKDGGRLANRYAPQKGMEKSPLAYQTFARTGDIYCLFYERGLQLCRAGGHLCYITSNKWMRSAYGEKTRKFFLNNNPLLLIDFGSEIFEAVVDTNILLLQNAKNVDALRGLNLTNSEHSLTTEDITKQMEEENVSLRVNDFPANKLWFISSAAEIALTQKIEQIGTSLEDWDVSIKYGIKAGYDEAFIIDKNKRQEILDACADKAEKRRTDAIIKPFLRGRDIKRYRTEWAGLYVIVIPSGWTDANRGVTNADNFFGNTYPQIKKHLMASPSSTLVKGLYERSDQGDYWWELRSCDYYSEFEKEKIIYPDTTKFLPFILDKGCYYISSTCFILTGENLTYLVSIFNSLVVQYWIKKRLPDLGGDRFRLKKIFMVNLPVPKITDKTAKIAKRVAYLAEEITLAKESNKESITLPAESEIDKLVYTLYTLTPTEITLIEGTEQ